MPSLANNWRATPAGAGMGGAFEPKNLNSFGYVGQNPLVHTDPDGAFSWSAQDDRTIFA